MLYLETILSKVCNALIQSPKINLFELPNEEKQAHLNMKPKMQELHSVLLELLLPLELSCHWILVAIGTFVAIGTYLPLELSCHWFLVAIGTYLPLELLLQLELSYHWNFCCHWKCCCQ